jgi:hypothetical protein
MKFILSTNPNRKSGYVLGYFQPSPFDRLRAGSSGLASTRPEGRFIFSERWPNPLIEKSNLDKSVPELRRTTKPTSRLSRSENPASLNDRSWAPSSAVCRDCHCGKLAENTR